MDYDSFISTASSETAAWLATTTPPERFDADEFVRRVSEREDVALATARHHISAVLDALAAPVRARSGAM